MGWNQFASVKADMATKPSDKSGFKSTVNDKKMKRTHDDKGVQF